MLVPKVTMKVCPSPWKHVFPNNVPVQRSVDVAIQDHQVRNITVMEGASDVDKTTSRSHSWHHTCLVKTFRVSLALLEDGH